MKLFKVNYIGYKERLFFELCFNFRTPCTFIYDNGILSLLEEEKYMDHAWTNFSGFNYL